MMACNKHVAIQLVSLESFDCTHKGVYFSVTIGGDQEKKVSQKCFKNNINKRLILNTPIAVVRGEEQCYYGKSHLRDEIN